MKVLFIGDIVGKTGRNANGACTIINRCKINLVTNVKMQQDE
jgi:calcineurin-like phosphoesterase